MATSDHADGELERRVRQQEVVAELGTLALEGHDLDDLLAEATTAVRETLGADHCKVLELLPGEDELLLRQGVGWKPGVAGSATVPTDRDSQAGYTLLSEEPVVVVDLEAETRFSGPDLLVDHDVTSGISVVVGSVEEPWGVLGVHTTDRRAFTEHDVTFVRSVANLLATAIESERAERRLAAEKELKDRIVETSPIGILHLNADGSIAFANERATEILRRDRETVESMSNDDPEWGFVDASGEPLPDELIPSKRVLREKEQVFGFEMGVRDPDGGHVWVSVNAEPLRSDDGEVTGAVLAFEDVTERKRLESELETTFNRITDAFYALDTEWNFTYLNERAATLIDVDDEGLVGENIWEEFEWAADSKIEREFRNAMETQEPTSFELYYPEPLETWFEVHGYPSETGLSVYFRDVTEEKETERQLRTERRLKERILETSPVGITLIDADGRNVFANERAQEILGRDLEEIRTHAHDDDRWNLVDEDGEPLSGEELPFARVEETEEAVYDEVIGIDHPDGSRVWMTAHCAPLFDDAGAFDGAVYALKDVTEQKRLESELETTLDRVTDAFNAFDTDWRFTYVNERAKELLGVEGSELIGENVWEAFPSAVGSRFEAEYRRAMETQESITFEEYSDVADAWIEVSAYPSETGLSVYFRDVTERKERERVLSKYEAIVETVDDGIYTIDDDGRFTMVNESYTELTGYSREALLGAHGSLVVDETTMERAGKLAADPDAGKIEAELETADGEVVTVEATVTSHVDGESGKRRRIGVVRDVTERKERERELARFERAVESSGHAIYMTDVDGRITYVNPAFEEVTGYSEAEALGRKPSILQSNQHDDGYYRDLWETVLSGAVWDGEITDRRRDGEIYHAEQTIAPVFDEDGEIDRLVAVQTDITDRRERERALEESEQRYRTLIDHFPNGAVGLFDEALRYTLVGGELIDERDVEKADLVGTSIHERYPEDVVAELEPKFDAVFDGEEHAFEVEYDGRDLSVNTLPVRDADGEVFAGMLVVRDVTERNEYQRKLEASNERLEQFAYAASHDLQEPLRMVSSYLTLVDRRYADELDEDGREFIEFAVDGAERMQEMIDGLLAYSRVDTRGNPFVPVDLEDVVDDVLTDLEVMVDEHDAEIEVGDLPRVYGDPGQLRQVFQNVLDNAITYAGDEPPRVQVSAERGDAGWIVSVRDEGIGIDADQTERVFEVFNRLHSADDYDGTGIGLALCQRIVERHGGRAWIDSEPGEGTTVSFTLPSLPADHD